MLGTVRAPTRLDRHGYVATLEVERVLRGSEPSGTVGRIAWEELGTENSRFREGQRILVVLRPLPAWSLWRERLPKGGARGVAARGDAFLDDPDAKSVELLQRWLALSPAARAGEAGARGLAELVASARPDLAEAALARLAASPDAAAAAPAALLGAALDDPGRPLALRVGILALEPDVLRPSRSRVALLADRSGPLELDALDALARLDGLLSPERVRGLLEREDASARALAVTRAGAALDLVALSALARGDPDPSVRAAAVAALARREETEALAAAGAGLFDPDGSVRASAAQGLGSRGAESVALLEELALQRMAPEAGGPIVALSLTGPAGRESLARLASSHPDPKARALAGLALGRPLPEDH